MKDALPLLRSFVFGCCCCCCLFVCLFDLAVVMSIYREENPYDGSIINRGMTEGDWLRLHRRVLPNPLTMEEFKTAVEEGRVHDAYLAKDLHKIMQEMRDLLKEHGELREAASFPLSGRKAELSTAAAAAVRVINGIGSGRCGSSSSPQGPLPHRRTGSSTAPSAAAEGDSGRASDVAPHADSPNVDTSPMDEAKGAGPPLPVTPGKNARTLPFTDHIPVSRGAPDGFDVLTTSTVPLRTASGPAAAAPPGAPELGHDPTAHRALSRRSWRVNPLIAQTVAQNASRERSPLRKDMNDLDHGGGYPDGRRASGGVTDGTAIVGEKVQATAAPTPMAKSEGAGPSKGLRNELAVLNDHSPPFAQILSVVRRFQLRYGGHVLKFEIPIQYAQAVATRRLRVHVIPLRHPNVPSRWPVAKEIVVYVNSQCVTTPWRRTWPERKVEVAKTYLPLDITQLLNRSHPQQSIEVDVFNRDYFTPALLAIVQPFTVEEVVERVLKRELGEAQLSRIHSLLREDAAPAAPGSSRVADNDRVIARFYQHVMEDDVDEGVEVDDPVITTKCPISQLPMETPVRGRLCDHLQCVDLQSHLLSCQKGAYWNCALCDRELRPDAIAIDTVLWRYLLRANGGLPHHLRLSVHADASSSPPTDDSGAALLAKYYWHPSRGGNEEANVLVDDEDDRGGDAHAGNRGSDDKETEEAAARREQLQSLEANTAKSEGDPALPTFAYAAKRPREPTPPLPEGSFENPIEL